MPFFWSASSLGWLLYLFFRFFRDVTIAFDHVDRGFLPGEPSLGNAGESQMRQLKSWRSLSDRPSRRKRPFSLRRRDTFIS